MPHVRSFKRSWDRFLVFYTLHSVIFLLLGPKEAWFEDIKKNTSYCNLHLHAALPALWNYRNNYRTSQGVESQFMHTSVIPQFLPTVVVQPHLVVLWNTVGANCSRSNSKFHQFFQSCIQMQWISSISKTTEQLIFPRRRSSSFLINVKYVPPNHIFQT